MQQGRKNEVACACMNYGKWGRRWVQLITQCAEVGSPRRAVSIRMTNRTRDTMPIINRKKAATHPDSLATGEDTNLSSKTCATTIANTTMMGVPARISDDIRHSVLSGFVGKS